MAGASKNVAFVNKPLVPLGYQQLADPSSATGLTVPDGAIYALIQAEGGDLRWRDDGTNPTAGVGMRIVQNDSYWYFGDLAAIKIIEEDAAAKANISYYGV